MDRSPRRRWLSFRLRTLLALVTVCALGLGWVNWNLQQVREQRRWLAHLRSHGAMFVEVPSQNLPWRLRMFGGHQLGHVTLCKERFLESDLARIKRVFPEASFEFARPTLDGMQLARMLRPEARPEPRPPKTANQPSELFHDQRPV
jgi:hypothetical protein